MQERAPISSIDLKTCISNMRKNSRFTEEIIELVQEDLTYGLTKEETEEYTERKFDYKQMKIYSQCLRNGHGKDLREVIAAEGLTSEQMAVALEFYEKGISLDIIKEVIAVKENTAFVMKKLFQDVLSKMQEAGNVLGEDELYAKELLEQIKAVVAKIEYQEQRYDMLNLKLKELQNVQSDTDIQNNLLKQLQEKDTLLEQQQNEINEARVAIARLKNELVETKKEKAHMEEKMNESQKHDKKEPDVTMADKKEGGMVMSIPKYPDYEGKEITYQAAIIDSDGRIVQMIPVEKVKKKNKGALTAFFSQIQFKKKIDIIRMVAEKNLSSKQLVQVRMGIEKGLKEQQLMVLINNNIPPEQMEEIINIAVYENNQKGD